MIITKDGKDYLQTSIIKFDNNTIECSKFFNDAKTTIDDILSKKNIDTIEYNTYGSSLAAILKRFSGTYFSPSFMKGYMTNPAASFIGNFTKEEVSDATSIGTHVHKILELYYTQDKDKRDRNNLLQYLKDIPPEIIPQVEKYIKGYIPSKDYLDESKELDDKTLDCFCEYKGKTDIYIPKFDINIPLTCSYVVDRIDLREDKLYIIDYKTGYQTPKSASFDGYLSSMILYKWVVEQDFSMPVDKGYLSTPGNKDKYIPLEFSLVNESKCLEQVDKFCTKFRYDVENKVFEYTDAGYFNNADMKKFRDFMNDPSSKRVYPLEVYLGEHSDI